MSPPVPGEGCPLSALLTAEMLSGKLWNLAESFCHKNKAGWKVNLDICLETVMFPCGQAKAITRELFYWKKKKEQKKKQDVEGFSQDLEKLIWEEAEKTWLRKEVRDGKIPPIHEEP